MRQLEEIQDWLGTTKVKQDAMGRVLGVTYPDGKEVSYTYGARGERLGIDYPGGQKAVYEYDEYTRLSGLCQGGKSIHYEYNDIGLLAKKYLPNGVESSYGYDEKGQLCNLVHRDKDGILDQYCYEYDPLGNQISVTKQRRGLEEESGCYQYGYDLLGRLTDVTKDGIQKITYTYDAFGNRTGMKDGADQVHYEYNVLNQLVCKRDGATELSYGYDKRGNLNYVSEKGLIKNSYRYGTVNRLEEMVDAHGIAVRYRYNGLGHLTGKTVAAGPDELEHAPLTAIKEVEYRIDMTREYHNLLQKTETGNCQTYLWDDHVVGLFGTEMPEECQYFLQDDLGSPIRLLYQDGEIKEFYRYDEFGQMRYQEQPPSQPFSFTGYQRDEEMGSYFAQARYYQPEIGRFLSQDIIPGLLGEPLTMNRYSYCFNQPISLVDQNGMFPSWKDIKDGAKYLLDNWKEVATSTVDTIAEAVSVPVGVVSSAVVEWGNNNPEAMKTIRSVAQQVITPLCQDSPGALLFAEATRRGYVDDQLEVFGFKRDKNGVFHTTTDCWQKHLGYNDLYDWGFDAGTSMKRGKYAVVTSSGEEYCIWMWKGNYLNLGAGAETGIYKGGEPHWEVVLDDAMPMKLALYDKDGNNIYVYDPKDLQWWITGFDPMSPGMKEKDLMVIGCIDFSANPELWKAFKEKYGNKEYSQFCFDTDTKTVYYKW